MVQPGDTSLGVIAQKLLGSSDHWKAIAAANKFVDPSRLIPGRTKLLIPVDPKNVEGIVVKGGDGAGPALDAHPAVGTPAHSAPADGSFTEYVVRRQDTLSSIAKAAYGKAALWRSIYEANQDVIPDPDRLSPGVTIRIPKRSNP